ncbi:DNA polymerase III subunit beta [Intestinimonas sp.]|uniref:DNA polymerase III subunit beta n=1 Tax=Intestinimonas sp. TaxID=1965293 RepID=UPI00260474D2|nr:DNA polymerase III subunit beta [Intestinimonas sp.]
MRAVSVFPLDEFRLALKKVYGAAAPKGPFTALSQATLFFSRNSCTIACCNLNQWCQATIPAQGDEFSLTLDDTQRLLDACAYFSGELHLEYETAEKKPHNCDIPYNQARFSCGGREIHQLVFDSDLYPLPKEFQPEQVYQINAGTFFGLFTQVRHAVSSDTNRPWSCCVQFTDHRMYALDGYRLSVRTIPDFEAAKPFQIPEEAMELLSVFADEDCTLSIGREWLSVQNDSKRLITRVPPLGGLKLDSTIPTIFTEERWIDVEGTRNDVKYLLKMENKKLRAPLRLGDGWLSVRGNSGLYRAELRMERPPAIVIGYDPRYLLDAFDAFAKRGIKTARMSFTSPVGPTVLTADNGFTELILPVRLKPEEAAACIPPRKQAA